MKPGYFDENEIDDLFPEDMDELLEDMMPEEDDIYSPTSWDKDPYETDEEYEDRIKDQEDLMEFFDD